MTARTYNGVTTTFLYDAENHLVQVKRGATVIATFTYDGDGHRVKSLMGGETSYFIGNYYEWSGKSAKYYYIGGQRVAMRKYINGAWTTPTYFIASHLGRRHHHQFQRGSSLRMLYKPWGELRYAWSATASLPTDWSYTGQFSYMDDPTTSGVTEGFGLMFYQSRFYDPQLGQFTQATG